LVASSKQTSRSLEPKAITLSTIVHTVDKSTITTVKSAMTEHRLHEIYIILSLAL
jgi:hypothetical protein